jgi:hypothetical protein
MAVVAEYWFGEGEGWQVNFRRSLIENEKNSWQPLMEQLEDMIMDSNREDEISWSLEKSHCFSTRSLHMAVVEAGGNAGA